jgi:anti-sigma regulatory factor (Ser/Thr protein kinase)
VTLLHADQVCRCASEGKVRAMAPPEQRLELPPRPASAAAARRFVSDVLRPLGAATREVGVLLASELVTNALLYAQGLIEVRVQADEDCVRVSVRDTNHQTVAPKHVGPQATSGRGLALVEAMAADWGVDLIPDDGKEVWFELPGPRETIAS